VSFDGREDMIDIVGTCDYGCCWRVAILAGKSYGSSFGVIIIIPEEAICWKVERVTRN